MTKKELQVAQESLNRIDSHERVCKSRQSYIFVILAGIGAILLFLATEVSQVNSRLLYMSEKLHTHPVAEVKES